MPIRNLAWLTSLFIATAATAVPAADGPEDPAARRERAEEFHVLSQQRTGLLVPLYAYPADVHTNPTYNRLIALKRRHEAVPVWVILNPASGPGEKADGNYAKAVDRLVGAGCVVLGYVSTGYGKVPAADVTRDVDRWRELYPRVHGVFFDEMNYEDTPEASAGQVALTRHAAAVGFWPTVANPGADTPGRYFTSAAADVIVVHEGPTWPEEPRLAGDYFGGYADHPPSTRAVLVHSQAELDRAAVRAARRHVRWVYATDAPFRPGDPAAANPWDRLPGHLDELFEELARD